jgi:hypothetical protein
MSIFLVTILAISADASQTAPASAVPAAQAVAPAVARSGRELSEAAHAAMRHWAKATDQQADAAARELLGIYREIQQDTGMARSQRETLRLTVRARLDQLCTQIAKRVAKDKALAKDKAAAKPNAAVKSVAADPNATRNAVLAGVGVGRGGGGGFGGGAPGQNANAKADNGQALVDLIQNVISPKSWDVNGGECTIYYWQQQHAIVVRATGDVHDQISDTLEQLNRATH